MLCIIQKFKNALIHHYKFVFEKLASRLSPRCIHVSTTTMCSHDNWLGSHVFVEKFSFQNVFEKSLHSRVRQRFALLFIFNASVSSSKTPFHLKSSPPLDVMALWLNLSVELRALSHGHYRGYISPDSIPQWSSHWKKFHYWWVSGIFNPTCGRIWGSASRIVYLPDTRF